MRRLEGKINYFKRLACWCLGLIICGVTGGAACAQAEAKRKVVGERYGYLSSVKDERHLRIVEMVMVAKPGPDGPPLKEQIFDAELTDEFRDQYELRFGRTDAEININSANRFEEFEYNSSISVTIEEDQRRKRQFGEFMVRRLTEHHIDGYFKSDPSFRQVYELKDRLSNLNVKTKKGYKFKAKYSLSGNYLDLKVDNPFEVDTKVTHQLSDSETIVGLRYSLTKTIGVSSFYRFNDGILRLIGSKALQPGLSAPLTGSTYTHEEGRSVRQHLVLLGLSWTR